MTNTVFCLNALMDFRSCTVLSLVPSYIVIQMNLFMQGTVINLQLWLTATIYILKMFDFNFIVMKMKRECTFTHTVYFILISSLNNSNCNTFVQYRMPSWTTWCHKDMALNKHYREGCGWGWAVFHIMLYGSKVKKT